MEASAPEFLGKRAAMSALIKNVNSYQTKCAAFRLAHRHGGEAVETTAHGASVWAVRGCTVDEQTALECVFFYMATECDFDTKIDVFARAEDGLMVVLIHG